MLEASDFFEPFCSGRPSEFRGLPKMTSVHSPPSFKNALKMPFAARRPLPLGDLCHLATFATWPPGQPTSCFMYNFLRFLLSHVFGRTAIVDLATSQVRRDTRQDPQLYNVVMTSNAKRTHSKLSIVQRRAHRQAMQRPMQYCHG